jgi:hypothetical protein
MRSIKYLTEMVLWSFLAVLLLACGCASTAKNEHALMKPGFGEVHIYAPGETNLNWEVQRFDPKAERYRVLYSKLDPNAELILPLRAGAHQLRITALNRVVLNPATVAVSVQEQTATFVRVTLASVAQTAVETRTEEYRPTLRGGIRRTARYGSTKSPVYQISAEASSEPASAE